MTKILMVFFLILGYVSCERLSSKTETKDLNDVVAQTPVIVEKSGEKCITLNFHYLITRDEMYSPIVRHIEVFLDEKAFSEENLKILFTYLSSKYVEPKHLTIEVKTNWAQLSFPSDCPPIAASNQPNRPDEFDYHQAIFYRRDRKENSAYFRYNPVLKTEDFKTVVLKDGK